jgi:signal transduction histidine kinase
MSDSIICNFGSAPYIFAPDHVPLLAYYLHIPSLLISFSMAVFVLSQGHKKILNQIFSFTCFAFFIWTFLSLMTWSTNRTDIVMFGWSITILVEPLVFIGCMYLIDTIFKNKDTSIRQKIIWSILYLPLILITPTSLSIKGISLDDCFAVENITSHYSYILEVISLCTIFFITYRYISSRNNIKLRRSSMILSVTCITFLLIFMSGNIIGSSTGNWELGQIGFIGFFIFTGSVLYLTVKFRLFNIKILPSQALISALALMILSLIFIRNLDISVKGIIFLNLVIFIIIGFYYIKSTKRELEYKMELEIRKDELQKANIYLRELSDLKREFISLATHQIGTPLTAVKGYVSILLDEVGNGSSNSSILNSLNKVTNNLVHSLRDFLDIHRIEEGIDFNFETISFTTLLDELVNDYASVIKKDIILKYTREDRHTLIIADEEKMKRALASIIDNCIKHTTNGEIEIICKTDKGNFILLISDTGVRNIPSIPSKLKKVFSERYNSFEANIVGNSLGLYYAKQVVEGHSGLFYAEKKEFGDGVKFVVKMPLL